MTRIYLQKFSDKSSFQTHFRQVKACAGISKPTAVSRLRLCRVKHLMQLESLGLPPHVERAALTHGHDARAGEREHKHAHVAIKVLHLG